MHFWLNDFTKESDLNLNDLSLDCHMLDSYWLKYVIQSVITIYGCPQCHIRQFSGKS